MKLKTGDIICYRGTSVFAPFIRHFTKVPYSHYEVVVENWGVPFCNGAVGRGVISFPAEERLKGLKYKTDFIVKRYKKDFDEGGFAIGANSLLGHTKYDWINLLLHQLIWIKLGLWFGKSGKRAGEVMVCTEYLAWCYKYLVRPWQKYWLINPTNIFFNHDFETLREDEIF